MQALLGHGLRLEICTAAASPHKPRSLIHSLLQPRLPSPPSRRSFCLPASLLPSSHDHYSNCAPRQSRPLSSLATRVPIRTAATARMASAYSLPRLPIFDAISQHDAQSTAITHCLSNRSFKYGELLPDVCRARELLYSAAGKPDLRGERIAFLIENSYDYVVTFLAILAARAVALPLSPPFPAPELQYILNHSKASLLVHSPRYATKAQEVLTPNDSAESTPQAVTTVEMPKHLGAKSTAYETVDLKDESDGNEGAGMMLYTSGTTNRPKGVLLPESALTAQCQSLIQAWKYSPEDRLLHVLPLHHIHGTVNGVLTPLLAGSSVEFLFPFNAETVWRRFANPLLPEKTNSDATNGESKYARMSRDKVTFFTVVPTVYTRLLATHTHLLPDVAEAARVAVSPDHMRVSISGSAALPTPVKRAWKDLSRGNVLLERYGMTEVGMALSCGLDYTDRVDGSVGWPLPGVEARLVDTESGEVIAEGQETDSEGRERSGEIQLRGANVFREYFANPEATAKEFVRGGDEDVDGKRGWFKTGDVAVRRPVPGAGQGNSGSWAQGPMYFILGRQSADIIKSGGEKVSALEVERELLSLPEVAEAAVVAVPSGKWGQKVGAVIVMSDNFYATPAASRSPSPPSRTAAAGDEGPPRKQRKMSPSSSSGEAETLAPPPPRRRPDWKPMDMRRALRGRLAAYKIPQVLRVVDGIPRNAMGKINKKELVKAVFRDDFSGDEM